MGLGCDAPYASNTRVRVWLRHRVTWRIIKNGKRKKGWKNGGARFQTLSLLSSESARRRNKLVESVTGVGRGNSSESMINAMFVGGHPEAAASPLIID